MQNSKEILGSQVSSCGKRKHFEGQLRIPSNVFPYEVQIISMKLIHLLNKI